MSDTNKSKIIGGLQQDNSKITSLPKGTHYLFAIAINEYVHAPKLGNCLKDAEDFISLLTTRYQFSSKHVIRLFNEQATLPNIYNQLKELSKKIKPEDSLIIYFSGHGYMDKSDKSGHLVPVDGAKDAVWTYMSNDNLLSRIRAIKSFHTFLIIDSCFSGTLFLNRSMDSTALAEEVGRFPSRWGLAAGRIEEVADGYHGENSPFSKAVLSFLKTNTSAKFPVSDLIQYVKKVTPRNSDQTPIGGPLFKAGDMDGEFIFELQKSEVVDGKENVVVLPTSTILTPQPSSTNTPSSFLQKNEKYLVLLLLLPFIFWGISKLMNPAPQEATTENPIIQPTENNNPVTNIDGIENTSSTNNNSAPLLLSSKWGTNKIIATIEGGSPPYELFLQKNGKEKFQQKINQKGDYNIAITKAFREDAGDYQLVVKDANGNQQQKTVKIDAPKVSLKMSGSFADTRDRKTYKWVRLSDGKKWMTQNLNFNIEGSSCFENDENNCKKYGRLYTWDAVMKACPTGWRLPSDKEWWTITSQYGKIYSRERGNTDKDSGLNIYEHFAENGETGLNIQLGGRRFPHGKYSLDLDKSGLYWSSTEVSNAPIGYSFSKSGHASNMNLSHVGASKFNPKTSLSCRCIQN